ncbi:hypothetical protein FQN60_006197 [Etheostoma spectabile]|nr:hypothetical protein FQN60_006197 [Etheostoma spectabile]
MIGSQS